MAQEVVAMVWADKLPDDFIQDRAFHRKHFPEQNLPPPANPEPSAQGELFDNRSTPMSDLDRKEAMRTEEKHELDFWQRTAQQGRTLQQTDAQMRQQDQEQPQQQRRQPQP
jgi:hypothetical protein